MELKELNRILREFATKVEQESNMEDTKTWV